MVFDEIIPVLGHASTEGGRGFGLGMTTGQIGLYATSSGLFVVVAQMLLYSRVVNRVGELLCFKLCAFCFPLLYLSVPFLPWLNGYSWLQFGSLAVLLLLKNFCSMFAFPCSMVLLSRSALDIKHLSHLNSVSLVATGILRAVGSLIIGALYSWGIHLGSVLIPWASLAGLACLGGLPIFWLEGY